MKILIIMTGYFPGKKYGGPPVSIDNFCSLMNDYKCYIVTRNHDMNETQPYSNIEENTWINRENCKIFYLNDSNYHQKNFELLINEIKPDCLYLQGLFQNCIIPGLQLAKKYDIKVILAPRGELCKGAFKKKYKKIPYIMYLRMKGLLSSVTYQSTSDEETEAIHKYLKAESKRIHHLMNIPSIPSKNYVHRKIKKGRAKFIFLSRIMSKKNLLNAIQYFQRIEGEAVFDIYGSIEDETYWKNCLEEIKKLPSNIKTKYCGLVSHDQVHEIFSKYDAFLFPTLSENFGHVIAEALSVGCPVIISDQTPFNDIEELDAGWAIPLKMKDQFCRKIQLIIDMDPAAWSRKSISAKNYIEKKINKEILKESYCRLIEGGVKN